MDESDQTCFGKFLKTFEIFKNFGKHGEIAFFPCEVFFALLDKIFTSLVSQAQFYLPVKKHITHSIRKKSI